MSILPYVCTNTFEHGDVAVPGDLTIRWSILFQIFCLGFASLKRFSLAVACFLLPKPSACGGANCTGSIVRYRFLVLSLFMFSLGLWAEGSERWAWFHWGAAKTSESMEKSLILEVAMDRECLHPATDRDRQFWISTDVSH